MPYDCGLVLLDLRNNFLVCCVAYAYSRARIRWMTPRVDLRKT
jgi:hypothetical protein